MSESIRVRATQLGWYGERLRAPGDVFDYVPGPNETELATWMELAPGAPLPAAEPGSWSPSGGRLFRTVRRAPDETPGHAVIDPPSQPEASP